MLMLVTDSAVSRNCRNTHRTRGARPSTQRGRHDASFPECYSVSVFTYGIF